MPSHPPILALCKLTPLELETRKWTQGSEQKGNPIRALVDLIYCCCSLKETTSPLPRHLKRAQPSIILQTVSFLFTASNMFGDLLPKILVPIPTMKSWKLVNLRLLINNWFSWCSTQAWRTSQCSPVMDGRKRSQAKKVFFFKVMSKEEYMSPEEKRKKNHKVKNTTHNSLVRENNIIKFQHISGKYYFLYTFLIFESLSTAHWRPIMCQIL